MALNTDDITEMLKYGRGMAVEWMLWISNGIVRYQKVKERPPLCLCTEKIGTGASAGEHVYSMYQSG